MVLYSVYMTQTNRFLEDYPAEIRNYIRAEKEALEAFQSYRVNGIDAQYKKLQRRWIFSRDLRVNAIRKYNLCNV